VNRKTTNAMMVIITASAISQVDSGPLPKIIGIGPIRITTPPLVAPWPCEKEAIIITTIPMNTSAKLANKIQESPMGNVLFNCGASV
jgi:hypothetical protein